MGPRLRGSATPIESLRIERVISVARVFLTLLMLFASEIEDTEVLSRVPAARALLVLFIAHSLSALVILRTQQRISKAFVFTTSAVDLLAAAVTLPLATPTNALFGFFLFVLAASTFRWGFRETAVTAALATGLAVADAQLAAVGPAFNLAGGHYAVIDVVTRAAYLSTVGLLLAYLAEEGRRQRGEAAAIADLLSGIRVHVGVTRAVGAAATQLLALFGADSLILVVDELTSRRLVRWDTARGWSVLPADLRPEDRATYAFGPADRGLTVVRRPWWLLSGERYQTTAVDAAGRILPVASGVPEAFLEQHPFRCLVAAPVALGDDWAGRVFVVNPRLAIGAVGLARFLQSVLQQVGPVVFNVYLLGQLRAKAGAMERARVARELHDGVIQSLLGVEMQLEALRGSPVLQGQSVADDLRRLQTTVHNEGLSLRELMQQVRPPEFDPDELLAYLADLVQRFGRDAGIAARFTSDQRDVALPPRICFELVRVVQEALVNVRKHAEASNVLVRFAADEGDWCLQVGDDGRGFPFEGRLDLSDLDASNRGPIIIKERVRAIGARLVIESTPGKGSRLEIRVPQERRG